MKKDVYIVHCIDTEGPLYESLEATFKRLEEIFNVKLEPTLENLKKIQNGELYLGEGKEVLVADAFSQKRICTLGTWTELDLILDELLSHHFRNQIIDSDGNGWVYNWFCLDHVGFTGLNPRCRVVGPNNIYDHYFSKLKETKTQNIDLINFHYHPLPFNGHYHYCGTAYLNSNNIFQIVARKIIDRHYFPAVFRAGMEAERPDSHWFLEQWIPFDFSCDSYEKKNEDRQPDLRGGRYGDWRRATLDWCAYHPDHADYQLEGTCKRWITRCMSLDSRVVKLEQCDIEQAFEQAESGRTAILSFANHDFRDMRQEVSNCMKMILNVSKKHPDIKFHFSDAISAMINALQIDKSKPGLRLDIQWGRQQKTAQLQITAEGDFFGTQPFLAIKTVSGEYLWDNFDYGIDSKSWQYIFDDKTLNTNIIEQIGVAINSKCGISEIIIANFENKTAQKYCCYANRVLQTTDFNIK